MWVRRSPHPCWVKAFQVPVGVAPLTYTLGGPINSLFNRVNSDRIVPLFVLGTLGEGETAGILATRTQTGWGRRREYLPSSISATLNQPKPNKQIKKATKKNSKHSISSKDQRRNTSESRK